MEPIAVIELKDGRTVYLNHMQACTYVAIAAECQALGMNTNTEVLMFIVSKIAEIESADKATKGPLSFAEIKTMRRSTAMPLTKPLMVQLKQITNDGDTATGMLPSGRKYEITEPSIQDTIDAEKAATMELKAYSLVCKCVKIEGQPMSIHEVEIMDGLDFMCLAAYFQTTPN